MGGKRLRISILGLVAFVGQHTHQDVGGTANLERSVYILSFHGRGCIMFLSLSYTYLGTFCALTSLLCGQQTWEI